MPFIGTQPDVGGYSVLDALTASATASYTLQKDSANFVPSSANQLLVSLNGVIQKPGSSFTVSGSTLTFSSALTSSDSIDFILAMGEPLLVGTPSDGTVSTAKIGDNAVTSAGAGPASLCWEWRNHDTLSDPGEGKAAWYSSSSFFRLNLKTANGVFLGKNVLARNDVSFSQHLAGGIWTLVDGDWQMVQLFQIHRMQWNHNDCVWLYRNNVILGSNNFTAGQKYYFTVGGFF